MLYSLPTSKKKGEGVSPHVLLVQYEIGWGKYTVLSFFNKVINQDWQKNMLPG